MTEQDSSKKDLLNRLNRVEGQIRGIKKMIEEDKYCLDVLHQIWAARSTLTKASELLLENHVNTCFKDALGNTEESTPAIDELIKAIKALMN